MPGVARQTDKSTGHGCFAPTPITDSVASTVFTNGKKTAKVGSKCTPHKCGLTTHADGQRAITQGSGTVRVEGSPIARIGDAIACTDKIGQASGNVYAGG